jgi:hypothetical protein
VTETVYEWLKTGKLAGLKINDGPRAKWRVTPAALDEFDRAQLRSRCSPRDATDTVAGS